MAAVVHCSECDNVGRMHAEHVRRLAESVCHLQVVYQVDCQKICYVQKDICTTIKATSKILDVTSLQGYFKDIKCYKAISHLLCVDPLV